MNNYGEIMDRLLAFSRKRAMVSELSVAKLSNSWVVVYWSVSIVYDNFRLFRHCGISHNYGLWN